MLRQAVERAEGFIFDMDGTLLDSMHIWLDAGANFLKRHEIQPADNLGAVLKNMNLQQAANYLKAQYALPMSVEEMIREILDIVSAFYREEAELKSGVCTFLEQLAQRGVAMCVLTASDKALAEAALTRLGVRQYFKEIITCGETGLAKDNPKIFDLAVQRLGTRKEKTIVADDALYAVRTAKQAGLTVLGVYDASEADRLAVSETADYYIHSFTELL